MLESATLKRHSECGIVFTVDCTVHWFNSLPYLPLSRTSGNGHMQEPEGNKDAHNQQYNSYKSNPCLKTHKDIHSLLHKITLCDSILDLEFTKPLTLFVAAPLYQVHSIPLSESKQLYSSNTRQVLYFSTEISRLIQPR